MKTYFSDVSWKQVIFIPLMSQIVFIFISWMVLTVSPVNAVISLGNSVQLNQKYNTSINIKNHSSSAINDLKLYIAHEVEIKELHFDRIFEFVSSANTINLPLIQPKESIDFILVTSSKLNEENFSADSEKKINTNYFDNQINIQTFISQWYPLFIIMFTMYVIFFLSADLYSIRVAKRNEEIRKDLLDKSKHLQDRSDYNEQKMDEIEKKYNDLSVQNRKLKFYYINRMGDLKKELDFWRDTIRKSIYSMPKHDSKNVDDLFRLVTKNLKTFTVNEQDYDDIDAMLYVMSKIKYSDEEVKKNMTEE